MTKTSAPASLTDRLHQVLASRTLGARLTSVLTDEAALHSRWGHVTGPAAAELAALPLSLAMPGLDLLIEDALHISAAHVVLRGQVTGRVEADGLLGPGTGTQAQLPFQAEALMQDDRIAQLVVICDSTALSAAPQGLSPLPTLSPAPTAPANPWAKAWLDLVRAAAEGQLQTEHYDPALTLHWPGAHPEHGIDALDHRWSGLRSALPSASFTVLSCGAVQTALSRPRAVVRWQLRGLHEGWGPFGAPSGADVTIDGFSMAEFGPDGVLRDWTLYDPRAVRDQIAAQTADTDP